jgi:uncharacterized NAD(P)/FAD-binding protein YdhS
LNTSTSKKHTIAIIGGGFSGTITAVNLLRNIGSSDLKVILIEQEPIIGRGLAYRYNDDNLLLNVPAGNMSALVDQPNHFVHYCQNIDPSLNSKSFISRRLYGEYLQDMLAEAEKHHPTILEKVNGLVIALNPVAKKFHLKLANHNTLEADKIVMALGHFQSNNLSIFKDDAQTYVLTPWDLKLLEKLNENDSIAIVGTGHTAIDILFKLTNYDTKRKIYLISRHGLIPHDHRFNPHPPHITTDLPHYLIGVRLTIRSYLRALRKEVDTREKSGGNWRDVMNEVRPHSSYIWQNLPEVEKSLFLKKLLPYWNIHRHRLAPSASRRLVQLLNSQKVELISGGIVGYEIKQNIINLQLKTKPNNQLSNIEISTIVNCIGPNYDISKTDSPLVSQLLNDGLIQQDKLKLGLLVDVNCCVLNANNESNPNLFYIGPMLRANYWETIAVPELRNYAYKLAKHLLANISD